MTGAARPSTAVILGAGMGTRLGERGVSHPKGFLRLGERPIIEESLGRLKDVDIDRVIIATGHCAEWYEELAAASGGFVETVHNPRYADSGSMYSLYCARTAIDGDFLLLESDLIFESRALREALDAPSENCVLLSDFTQSGDEVYVEAPAGRLINMSKNRDELGTVTGELVGICRISDGLFRRMIEVAERAFDSSLKYDYESDCLVAAAQNYPVHCHLAEDLAWAEIDDDAHWQRAVDDVYPKIVQRDARPSGA